VAHGGPASLQQKRRQGIETGPENSFYGRTELANRAGMTAGLSDLPKIPPAILLEDTARRIRLRALRRSGELLQQVPSATPYNNPRVQKGPEPLLSRMELARQAGVRGHLTSHDLSEQRRRLAFQAGKARGTIFLNFMTM